MGVSISRSLHLACLACALSLISGCTFFDSAPPAPPSAAASTISERTLPSALEAETAPPLDETDLSPVVGLDFEAQRALDEIARRAIAEDRLPGCVILLGRSDGVIFRRAYGARSLLPERSPMTEDTLFDVASLTKVIVTVTAVMKLVEEGRLEMDAPVARFIPEFASRGKERVTIRDLLLHQGGLPGANGLDSYLPSRERSLRRIYTIRPFAGPGEVYRYSDLGFIVLGEVVARITGQSLDEYARAEIFEPLSMRETLYRPGPALRARAAPTEIRKGEPILGEVDDPRAYRLGGVAGNAGLFSTADDLSRFARMLLDGGELDGVRMLSRASIDAMTTPLDLTDEERRGLGWDMFLRAEQGLSPRSYGHGGYTGTWIWVDPELDLYVVFLSNAVHPRRREPVRSITLEVAAVATAALADTAPARPARALAGIDVLRRDGFATLRGRRVGLITNVSGRARDGRRTLDLLVDAPAVDVRAVFSPEHGLGGRDEGRVGDDRDERTGLPVHSLFGSTRRPSAEALAELDVLVFDIQDVGTRFYTYVATLRETLIAASEAGLDLVILDRPNPLGGLAIEGPLVHPSARSFVNSSRLPVRHGMTLGELASLFRERLGLTLELEVIRAEGWRREFLWSDTGLPWVAPSPNLREPVQALLYPALGLLEGTNVSVGRGTDAPFELLGAPWMDPGPLLAHLSREELPGVRFRPASFEPDASRHRGRPCRGIGLEITDARAFRPVRTGLALARALMEVHPDAWDTERLGRLVAAPDVLEALLSGRSLDEVERLWSEDLAAFAQERSSHLIYP